MINIFQVRLAQCCTKTGETVRINFNCYEDSSLKFITKRLIDRFADKQVFQGNGACISYFFVLSVQPLWNKRCLSAMKSDMITNRFPITDFQCLRQYWVKFTVKDNILFKIKAFLSEKATKNEKRHYIRLYEEIRYMKKRFLCSRKSIFVISDSCSKINILFIASVLAA